MIDLNIHDALSLLNGCIKQRDECMKRQIRMNKSKKLDEWFDHGCKVGRRNVRKPLKEFRRSLDVGNT